jgi:hypothetical protein
MIAASDGERSSAKGTTRPITGDSWDMGPLLKRAAAAI